MALVFTAIADSLCALLLWSALGNPLPDYSAAGPAESSRIIEWTPPSPVKIAAVVVISIGLYGFGMSLNDIIDRRRDSQLAAHRPLPSGRIGVGAANLICLGLICGAIVAGAFYAVQTPWPFRTILLIIGTALLITFYDAAGKYLVGLGIITLGMIRFFHAAIPAARIPLIWHPLFLLNHVTILSLVCYHWERKRPSLTRGDFIGVLGSLGLIDAAAIAVLLLRRHRQTWTLASVASALEIRPALALPAAAALAFVVIALVIRRRSPNSAAAGKTTMLYGLLWLIVYDSLFVAGYVDWRPALVIFLLLPVAYLSVQLIRWWSEIVLISQRPTYRRAH
jgi:4-hydroxybenzoate polyprenyltransferase